MSAAQWRKAMNTGAAAQAWPRSRVAAPTSAAPVTEIDDYADVNAPAWLKWIWRRVSARHVFVLALVLIFPFVATPFFTFQIGAQSKINFTCHFRLHGHWEQFG